MKFESNETPINPHEKPTEVLLHFVRHSIKESAPTKPDEEIHLTQEGKDLARSKASSGTDVRQSLSIGSSRIRTQETAAFMMTGGQEEVKGDENIEELVELLNKDLDYGSKIATDQRLDISVDKSSEEYWDLAVQATKEKRFLEFLVKDSDPLAREFKETKLPFVYSRLAGRIAEIVKKYIKVSSRWNELVNNKEKNYQPRLDRFLSSHQTVLECFLAKVIEKTEGIGARDAFVEALNKEGFDFAEGFDISIKNSGDQIVLIVKFIKEKEGDTTFEFNQEIPIGMIDEIIEEAESINQT